MIYAETHGERALLATIINHAIVEAKGFKRPRPPSHRGMSQQKKKHLICDYYIFLKMLEVPFLYNVFCIQMAIKFVMAMKDKLKEKATSDKERLAWQARLFLDHKNQLFCFYVTLLDIDPKALCEKITKHLRSFDNGEIQEVRHGNPLTEFYPLAI